jgi:hypothetical protein
LMLKLYLIKKLHLTSITANEFIVVVLPSKWSVCATNGFPVLGGYLWVWRTHRCHSERIYSFTPNRIAVNHRVIDLRMCGANYFRFGKQPKCRLLSLTILFLW